MLPLTVLNRRSYSFVGAVLTTVAFFRVMTCSQDLAKRTACDLQITVLLHLD